MGDARKAILDRIGSALRTARIPSADAMLPLDRDSADRSAGDASDSASVDLLARFAAEARALGVEVFIEQSAEAVRDRLASCTTGRRVLAWSPERLPYAASDVLAGAMWPSASYDEQATADVGVTGCHGAIAETGSLALLSEPGCSRTVSLLPAVHVALVQARDLFFGMGEFFAVRAGDIARVSNLTFVTGPSRTADIELSLTIGVHGPAHVIAIVGP